MENFKIVNDLLSKLNITRHLTKFQEEEYDDDCLLGASDSDLRDLGLSLGERKKMLLSIKDYKSKKDSEDQLAEFYNHEDFIHFRRIDRTKLRLDACYVNLRVIPKENHNSLDKKGYKSSESDFSRTSEQLIEDRRTASLAPIELKNLFGGATTNSNWENIKKKRIIIFGKAGVGKSTLCKKIVYDYYKKNVWGNYFHRVIWLALRDLKQISKPDDKVNAELSDVFTQRFFNRQENGLTLSKTISEEENSGKKILYILDGWDEIGDLLNDGHFMKKVLLDLLKKDFLIVTSRPYTMGLQSSDFDQVLETVGFERQDIFKYVKTVMSNDDENQNKILNFVNSHSTISRMASMPIQLDMICYLCTKIEDLEQCLNKETVTTTKLYNVMVKKMMDLSQLRKSGAVSFEWISSSFKNIFEKFKNRIEDQDISQMVFLTEVAYFAFLENQIEFNDKFFSKANSYSLQTRENLKNSYFLNCLNPSESADEKRSYSFVHLTFQEYMAALYIVHLLGKHEMAQLVAKNKYNPRFKIIWSFVSGLIDEPEELDLYFNYLERSPVEITGIPHQLLMTDCLNECGHVLNDKRMDRILAEMWKWLPSGIPLETLKFPNKLYEKMMEYIFNVDQENSWKAELYLSNCHFLPESILLRLLDFVFREEDLTGQDQLLFNKAIKIVKYKHNIMGLQTIGRIERRLNEVLMMETSSDRHKALFRSRIFIDLFVDCELNDSTYDNLLRVFDEMFSLSVLGAKGAKSVLTTISKVVGNSCSKYKDELMHKLTEIFIMNNERRIREIVIHECLYPIKVLPDGIQLILAEYFDSMCSRVLTRCFETQKFLHSEVIKKMVQYVQTQTSANCQCSSFNVLSSQNNLTEDVLEQIFQVFQSTDNADVKSCILHLFFRQEKISDMMADRLTADFDKEDVLVNLLFPIFLPINQNAYGSVIKNFGYLKDEHPTIPTQIVEKLGELFNIYHSRDNAEVCIKIVRCLKRLQQIPESMIANLYARFQSRNQTIDEIQSILECLQFPCAFCHKQRFSSWLFDLAKCNDVLLTPISKIFTNHPHIFDSNNSIEKLQTLILNSCDAEQKFNLVQILAFCKNVPSDLLLSTMGFLMNLPSSNDDQTSYLRNKRLTTLRLLLINQENLSSSILKHMFDINSWWDIQGYANYADQVLDFLPLSKILDNLDESNWKNVFDYIIVRRLKKTFSPIPVMQIEEDKNALAMIIPAENDPQAIKHLELCHIINKMKTVPYLPLRPDVLTLFFKFHTAQESLLHIQNLPMNFGTQKMDIMVCVNEVKKYIKLFICKENPTDEDFDTLFKEITDQLKTGYFLHLDLRNNHLQDNHVPKLKNSLLTCEKIVSTIILSNNQITCGKDGLRSLLDKSFCNQIGLKFLFMDRNNIYLNQDDFKATLRNSNSLVAESGLELLDISGNFIPEGKLGPYWDNILAPRHVLLNSGLSEEELQQNVQFIKNSSILNSCEVADEAFSFIPIHNQFHRLKSDLEYERRISKSVGCIVLAYGKTSLLSKHAFFGIDWVPPDLTDNFGQRQLIKSELVTDPADKSQIRIKILQMPPAEFISKFRAENVKIRGVVFVTTEKIRDFLENIFKSRDTANIYEYKLFASSSSSLQGEFNCITWADLMLQQCGITLDTMKTSYPFLLR